jgi:hypothetical protein
MPGADESYRYREAGLSQQACEIARLSMDNDSFMSDDGESDE